jgi:hypothetical protein
LFRISDSAPYDFADLFIFENFWVFSGKTGEQSFSTTHLPAYCASICEPKKVKKKSMEIIIAGVLLKDFTTVPQFEATCMAARAHTKMGDPSLESYKDDHLLSVRCQRYELISEQNFLKIANFQFHPLTVSRKITHTNEIL